MATESIEMAGRTNNTFVDWIPYEPNGDVLDGHISYENVRIQDIPPSTFDDNPDALQDISPPGGPARGKDVATAKVQSDLINSLNKGGSFIPEWVQYCEHQGLKVDMNRLVRFVICRNSLFAWISISRSPGVDFTRPDTMGRSAIFYALWPFPDNDMLSVVIQIFNGRSALENFLHHRDRDGNGLMHYATKLKGLDAVEFLLTTNQTREIGPAHGLPLLFEYDHSLWDDDKLVNVLLRGKHLIDALPTSRSGCFTELSRVWEKLKSPLLQRDNCELTWLSLPWIYGVSIFSLLRRLSRDESRPVIAVTDVPIINMTGDPYTDPCYVSNLNGVSRPEQNLGRQVYIVFPCLVLQFKEHYIEAKKKLEKWKIDHNQVFIKSVLRSERTLDETYFPSLSDKSLDHRDDEQVVSRYDKLWVPILIVPNLWVWRCGYGILTTYSADSTHYGNDSEHSTHLSWGPGIQVGTIIAQRVSDFGEWQHGSLFPPPLDIFEREVVKILEEVDAYIGPNSALRPEMEKERDFMFRIADVREELVMILAILGQQLEIVEKMIEDFEKSDPDIMELLDTKSDVMDERLRKGKKEWERVKDTPNAIEKHRKRAKKIDADAERVERMIQNQLNLKRTYASFEDARTSLLLGTAVIGFTVITVIFAPLAFMTALFALPIDVLVRNQVLFDRTSAESSTMGEVEPIPTYASSYVGRWFIVAEVVSLAVTTLLVWICLRFLDGKGISAVLKDRVKETMKKLNKRVEKIDGIDVTAESVRGREGLRDGTTKLFRRRHRRQNRSDEV
ncbi:hypothetical protein HD806DRAFT_65144 [Xylariaceae sp. AK1471]|nr:hypothetical protein HD806DRAFT_65144 [Xylariaceae sp. AK1471]